jgi:hypothetical protein
MSTLLGPVVIDDRDTAVDYSRSQWLNGESDRQFGGTCKFSRVAGANATLSFSGTLLDVSV